MAFPRGLSGQLRPFQLLDVGRTLTTSREDRAVLTSITHLIFTHREKQAEKTGLSW